MSGVLLGPCRNSQVDPETGEILVPCPHDGEAPYIEIPEMLAAAANMPKVLRGMCEGCVADDDAEEEKRELVKRDDRLARVKDGPRDRTWSFATYPTDGNGKQAFEAAHEWLLGYRDGRRQNLLVWGPVGTGKTGLAWCLARELILTDGLEVQLVNWRNLLYDIRSSFGMDPGQRREQLDRYFNVAVLFLDDVGAEKPTEWASEQLSILVDERYMAGRVTGITSNYALSQLVDRLSPDGDTIIGQRIVSRLAENATKLEVKGKDRRLA